MMDELGHGYMGPLLNTAPGHSTDNHSLTQLPPNPVSPRILTYTSEDDSDEDSEDLGVDDG